MEELKKIFVQNLLKAGYVKVDDKDRTILTDSGQKFLANQTKNAAIRVELAKLKNLEYRRSLERKTKRQNWENSTWFYKKFYLSWYLHM